MRTARHEEFDASGASGMPAGSFEFTNEDFVVISQILREATGIHLLDSKATLVYSRIAKRLRALGLASFSDYCRYIAQDAGERQGMIEALTTNTTSFFREQHHFDLLEREVLPPLVEAARRRQPVRLWSSASSSGQEPYSIALSLLKVAPDAPRLDIRILATDINTQMVAKGLAGDYSDEDIGGLSQEHLSRYFKRGAGERGAVYTATPDLKALIRFRQLNLQDKWPMRVSFDVIFCRNVMIYFAQETQTALWQRLAQQLQPGGYLFIGHSERVTGPCAATLEQVGITAYRKRTERRP